jgi:hypothetical protein
MVGLAWAACEARCLRIPSRISLLSVTALRTLETEYYGWDPNNLGSHLESADRAVEKCLKIIIADAKVAVKMT